MSPERTARRRRATPLVGPAHRRQAVRIADRVGPGRQRRPHLQRPRHRRLPRRRHVRLGQHRARGGAGRRLRVARVVVEVHTHTEVLRLVRRHQVVGPARRAGDVAERTARRRRATPLVGPAHRRQAVRIADRVGPRPSASPPPATSPSPSAAPTPPRSPRPAPGPRRRWSPSPRCRRRPGSPHAPGCTAPGPPPEAGTAQTSHP